MKSSIAIGRPALRCAEKAKCLDRTLTDAGSTSNFDCGVLSPSDEPESAIEDGRLTHFITHTLGICLK
jgi:hypothetical protein